MPDYRRVRVPGGTSFFTVNLLERRGNDLLTREISNLRAAVRHVQSRHPFHIDAWVVLPDHLHCVLTLPTHDADFSTRWRLMKMAFAKALPPTERRSKARQRAGERGIWQRRFWQHVIRDDADYARHIDYVYVNPVKHGLVARVRDWPYSTFHRDVRRGLYVFDWYGDATSGVDGDA